MFSEKEKGNVLEADCMMHIGITDWYQWAGGRKKKKQQYTSRTL